MGASGSNAILPAARRFIPPSFILWTVTRASRSRYRLSRTKLEREVETIHEAVQVAEGIWVSPAWLRPPVSLGQKWIKIEPKMAFGTGHTKQQGLPAGHWPARSAVQGPRLRFLT